MKIILITGFEPFGGERVNPSGALLDHLPETVAGAALCKLLLPVSYRKSADLLLERIDALQPNALVMLGQEGGRQGKDYAGMHRHQLESFRIGG